MHVEAAYAGVVDFQLTGVVVNDLGHLEPLRLLCDSQDCVGNDSGAKIGALFRQIKIFTPGLQTRMQPIARFKRFKLMTKIMPMSINPPGHGDSFVLTGLLLGRRKARDADLRSRGVVRGRGATLRLVLGGDKTASS